MKSDIGQGNRKKTLSLVIVAATGFYTLIHFLYSGVYYPLSYQEIGGDYFRHLDPVIQFLKKGYIEGEIWYGPLHYLMALPILYFFPGNFGVIFYTVDTFCIFGSIYYTYKTLSDNHKLTELFIIGVIWLNSSPLYYALGMRSVELYEILCLSTAFYLFNKGNEVQGSIWLALAAGFKYLPAIFVIYLIINKKWRPLGVFVLVLFCIYGISGIVFGNSYGFGSLLDLSKRSSAHIWWPNQSIGGILERVLIDYDFVKYGYYNSPVHPFYKYINLVENLIRLLLLISLFWILYRKNHLQTPFRRNLEFSMLLCYMLFLSPISWEHYGIFTLFAYSFLAVLIYRRFDRLKTSISAVSLGFSYLLAHYFFPKTLLRWLPTLKPGLDNTIAPQFYCTAALGWFLLLAILYYLHLSVLSNKKS